jgi:hypothetical protein
MQIGITFYLNAGLNEVLVARVSEQRGRSQSEADNIQNQNL